MNRVTIALRNHTLWVLGAIVLICTAAMFLTIYLSQRFQDLLYLEHRGHIELRGVRACGPDSLWTPAERAFARYFDNDIVRIQLARVTAEDFAVIERQPTVRWMTLGRIEGDEKSIATLTRLRCIEDLSLTLKSSKDIGAIIASMRGLETLTLRESSVPASLFGGTDVIPQVSTLRLIGCSIAPDALKGLELFPCLRYLVISEGLAKDVDLAPILQLVHIEALEFNRSGITDTQLAALSGIDIISIELDETNVSDSSINVLTSMERLRHCSLLGTRLSAEGRVRLQRVRPNVRFYFE